MFESIQPSPAWARWENRLLLAVLVLWAVLAEPVLGADWPTRRDLAVQGGLVLAVLVAWVNLETLAAGRSTAVLGPSLLVVAAGTAFAVLFSGYIVLGRIGGGLTAALGAVWVVSWWLPDRSLSRGGVPVLVVTCHRTPDRGARLFGPAAGRGLPPRGGTAGCPGWRGSGRRGGWPRGSRPCLRRPLSWCRSGVAVGLAFAGGPGWL